MKTLLLVLLLAGLMTGCGASSSSEQMLDEPEADDAAVPADAAGSTGDEAVRPVAERPQLLEFYADW